MKKIYFAADHNPTTNGYGMIALDNDDDRPHPGIAPVGPQDFDSEQAALNAFRRALGNAISSARADK
jgi:hypothetical protein